jgi:hypothetical protein
MARWTRRTATWTFAVAVVHLTVATAGTLVVQHRRAPVLRFDAELLAVTRWPFPAALVYVDTGDGFDFERPTSVPYRSFIGRQRYAVELPADAPIRALALQPLLEPGTLRLGHVALERYGVRTIPLHPGPHGVVALHDAEIGPVDGDGSGSRRSIARRS